jgi:hypothetical protein
MSYIIVTGNSTQAIEKHLATEYVNETNSKVVVINIGNKYFINDIPTVQFQKIDEITNGQIVNIDKCRKNITTIIESVFENLGSGMVIITQTKVDKEFYEQLSNIETDIDIIVYKKSLFDITKSEMDRLSYLRIHHDPSFEFSIENFQKLSGIFSKGSVLGIMLCQSYVNDQIDIRKDHITLLKKYYGDAYEVRADHEQIQQELGYHLFFSIIDNEILTITNKEAFTNTLNGFADKSSIQIGEEGIKELIDKYIQIDSDVKEEEEDPDDTK